MTPPVSVDWRDRWGVPWLATIQNQGGCQTCWAYASAALVETMVRIEHHIWSKCSEGDIRDGWGTAENWIVRHGFAPCEHSAGLGDALNWITRSGVADLDCYPAYAGNHTYTPTPDRSGRVVRIPQVAALTDVTAQKIWLDTVGPLAAPLLVYQTFSALGKGVWRKTALDYDVNGWANPEWNWPGGHIVLIVGYDDNQQCWIFRNSWGTGFGDNGYGRIGYGEAGIDAGEKYGLQLTDPDPWTKRRAHSGCMLESGNGVAHRNFEMLVPAPRVRHVWRQGGEGGDFSWHDGPYLEDPNNIGAGAGCLGYPALIASTYNRNFECVYWEVSGGLRHWYFDQRAGTWRNGGNLGPADAAGYPALIQSNIGAPGNFEVVVRTRGGQLAHWWRNNSGSQVWRESARFGAGVRQSGPALLQSRYGGQGNFELVCVLDSGRMQHFWRDNDKNTWNAGDTFGQGIGATPVCMIEGQSGAVNEKTAGNFELCVAVNGAVQHWWRDNNGTQRWNYAATFGRDVRHVWSLVASSFGFNLDVIVERYDGLLQHYWRDSREWHDNGVITPKPH